MRRTFARWTGWMSGCWREGDAAASCFLFSRQVRQGHNGELQRRFPSVGALSAKRHWNGADSRRDAEARGGKYAGRAYPARHSSQVTRRCLRVTSARRAGEVWRRSMTVGAQRKEGSDDEDVAATAWHKMAPAAAAPRSRPAPGPFHRSRALCVARSCGTRSSQFFARAVGAAISAGECSE
jgi:hypothetical protein